MNAVLVFSGFAIGTLVGLTGVGGGSLMTPLLVFLGLDPMVAVGSDLLYSLPTKLFGWYLYGRRNAFRPDVVKCLCIGGIPASLAGLLTLRFALTHLNVAQLDLYTRHAIGIAVCLSAAMTMFSPLILRKRKNATDEAAPQKLPAGRLIAIGALVGFLVSLTSIGGGAVALPLLVLCLPGVGIADLVGSDIAFAAILLLISAVGQWRMHHVDLGVTFNLLAGSLIGVYCGNKISTLLAQRWLRPAIAVALIVAGLRLA